MCRSSTSGYDAIDMNFDLTSHIMGANLSVFLLFCVTVRFPFISIIMNFDLSSVIHLKILLMKVKGFISSSLPHISGCQVTQRTHKRHWIYSDLPGMNGSEHNSMRHQILFYKFFFLFYRTCQLHLLHVSSLN